MYTIAYMDNDRPFDYTFIRGKKRNNYLVSLKQSKHINVSLFACLRNTSGGGSSSNSFLKSFLAVLRKLCSTWMKPRAAICKAYFLTTELVLCLK